MVEIAVGVHAECPDDLGPGSVVRFFPEHSAPHPLWLADGFPSLDDLRLPDALAARLRRWSAYWDSTFHWDDGWPPGTPEAWWEAEERALPSDVARALGREFVVEVDGRCLRSTATARSPAAAAALQAIRHASEEESARIAARIAAGATFTAIAGDTSYAEWLARSQDERTLPSKPDTD